MNYGLLAPAGTPAPIIERLNRALRAGIDTADVRARIAADGGDPLPSTPGEYKADIEREDARWGALIRKLNLKSSDGVFYRGWNPDSEISFRPLSRCTFR